jgi:hypothetical protein
MRGIEPDAGDYFSPAFARISIRAARPLSVSPYTPVSRLRREVGRRGVSSFSFATPHEHPPAGISDPHAGNFDSSTTGHYALGPSSREPGMNERDQRVNCEPVRN